MSIAWSSIVLLILLLPGLLFFVGTLFPEQFTRDAEQRSPLGQLGGALFISFCIHGTAYAINGWLCNTKCISVGALLTAINATAQFPDSIKQTDAVLSAYGGWILLYVLGTCLVGVGLGAGYGTLVTQRNISALTKHSWIYDLAADGLSYAYVMTRVSHDERVLMYKGFLRAAGLRADGRFSYLILRNAARYYMVLGQNGPETSDESAIRRIGESGDLKSDPALKNHSKRASESFLFIEGEDIANAVFDRLELTVEEKKTVKDIAREEREALDKTPAPSPAASQKV